ncbi:hypothetical protein CYMTET_36281 [Cymbomonas tetramitiformis]|uniref:Uncharacterized protein n=1 Tax=Cymbomonas tetramitiformis TaxID=36881 RepID=A0AAE0CGB6_9CHLO|nr:hypothetical protein CYMTET_36281 [Cymbomonas tetramitiformis]
MADLSEIISDAVVAKLQQSQSENTVSAGSVQPLEVTAHSEEQLEEKPVVDATVTDATVLEGSQEPRMNLPDGMLACVPLSTDRRDLSGWMDTPSPPFSEAEPVLSVEVDNPGTPEKEPKLKEPMTPTPNASRLQLAKKEMKTVTIPLNLLGDLLLDLLSTHRVDLVDLIEAGPHGVDLFYKALTLLGVPLTAYISAGGTVSGSPALLLSPAVTTYALMVNKHVVDAVLYDYHHSPGGRGVAPPVWMDITEWSLEEQSSMLDRDCLAAWFEVQRSQWYADQCHNERNILALGPPSVPSTSHATPSSSTTMVPTVTMALRPILQ